MYSKILPLIILTMIYMTGCDRSTSRKAEINDDIESSDTLAIGSLDEKADEEFIANTIESLEGDYVSDGYFRRAEGYDWVVVSIKEISPNAAYIRIQSRADRKKPTCTFEGIGSLDNKGMLKVDFEGNNILFLLDNKELRITTENKEQEDLLMYFCSGGGSLAGTYARLTDSLDLGQLKPSGFNRSLTLQGITFEIHASKQGSMNILIIQPSGLEIDNRLVAHNIDGNVTNVEVEDLNSDGSPEVLVYITSVGSGSYGSVVGYSVNNRRSMSQIYLPPIIDDPEISEGYMGHDEFAIVETTFARRFPVYKEGDSNSNPTGGIRQIQYKLVDGEASRVFKVDKVVEFAN